MEQLAPLLGKTLVIVAHPDDESVGCGGLMQRMREAVVLYCTDGAPRDEYFWRAYGSREAYARVRRQEAARAAAEVGVKRIEFLPPAENPGRIFVDQDLFLNIPAALHGISTLVEEIRPDVLLSLAYEGGHPDHDTCAFLTSWISREYVIPAWELPLYHRTVDGAEVRQEFLVAEGNEVLFDATPGEVERKHRMLNAYASQKQTIDLFNPAIERFRPQAAYDFSRPPHHGKLNYEVWGWPITGSQLVEAFRCCTDSHRHPRQPEMPGSTVRGLA